MNRLFRRQLRQLARRSVVRTFQNPANTLPAIYVPLFFFAVMSAGLEAATDLNGFPTTSVTSFALTITFAQGAMMAAANMGAAVATDVETGFMNRLALTPLQGAVLVAAQLAGAIVFGLIQAPIYLGVGLAAGAHVEAGVLGALVLVGLFLLAVLGFGAFGIFVGLRTGQLQVVRAMVPVMSIFLFLSSVIFPRDLIEADWFRAIATVNPISYLAEGVRSLLITGWNTQALALGFAVAGGMALLMLAAATTSVRARFVRT